MVSTTNDTSPYLLDDFLAFEQRLNKSKQITSTSLSSAAEPDTPTTLIEGIGSVDDLIDHGDNQASSPENACCETPSTPSTPSKIFPRPRPWDGTVSWRSISDNDSKYGSGDEASTPSHHPHPQLPHGLIYVPQRPNENAYRTAFLDHLPLDVSMKTMLSAVRGGKVLSAHLMNMEEIAGYHMGIVTFAREQDASAYAEFARTHGVYFNNRRIKVTLSKIPTYPMSDTMQKGVFNQGHTRCISIRGGSDSHRYSAVAARLLKWLPRYFELGDSMVENEDETEIIVRFNSIVAAQSALKLLAGVHLDCAMGFAPDPCGLPLPGALRDRSAEGMRN
ncbi:hypothetical protein FQN57_001870 [Myotisia sp. PD_48]|nr:hypothetical protein FQN57_001870 [Myotisia sp. PD_48]